jgi:hypothetical protein
LGLDSVGVTPGVTELGKTTTEILRFAQNDSVITHCVVRDETSCSVITQDVVRDEVGLNLRLSGKEEQAYYDNLTASPRTPCRFRQLWPGRGGVMRENRGQAIPA